MRRIIFMALFYVSNGFLPNFRIYFENKRGIIRIRIPIMKLDNYTKK